MDSTARVRTLKLTLAYDGTDFAGWQSQPGARTVQGTIRNVLEQITGEPITVMGSGRTDAGVHALGQVASFETRSTHPCDIFERALRADLPRDIAILSVEEMPTGFHALRSPRRKRYRYVIHDSDVRDVFARRYCWQLKYRLNDRAMQEGAAALIGRHDFSGFEGSGAQRESRVRTVVAADVIRPDPGRAFELHVEVEANGFLHNMVRVIVGTLVQVGRGVKPVDWVREVLDGQNRSAAGPTAPPEGLFLLWVRY